MPTTETHTFEPARLNFRLPAEIKERIENAARVSGITVTDFAISALSNSAEEVLRHHHNRVLSNKDRGLFLALLDNPPDPNKKMLDAVRKYKKRVNR